MVFSWTGQMAPFESIGREVVASDLELRCVVPRSLNNLVELQPMPTQV